MRKVNVDRKENDSDHTLQTIFLAVVVKAKVYDTYQIQMFYLIIFILML